MYSKIYNPKTKRKVSIFSKTGRLILEKYLKQIGGQNYFEIISYEVCGLNEKGNCHAKKNDEHCIQVRITEGGNKLCKNVNSLSPPVLTSTTITAPIKAPPVKVAPVKAAPVKAAPVKVAPVKAAPVKVAPVKVPPVKPGPVKAAPVKVAPVKADPVKADPVKAEPVKTISSIEPSNPFQPISILGKPLVIKENRVSASDYYKNHQGEYGDICAPRNDEHLRCLVPFGASAKWAEPSENSSTLAYKNCNLPPWKKKCKF